MSSSKSIGWTENDGKFEHEALRPRPKVCWLQPGNARISSPEDLADFEAVLKGLWEQKPDGWQTVMTDLGASWQKQRGAYFMLRDVSAKRGGPGWDDIEGFEVRNTAEVNEEVPASRIWDIKTESGKVLQYKSWARVRKEYYDRMAKQLGEDFKDAKSILDIEWVFEFRASVRGANDVVPHMRKALAQRFLKDAKLSDAGELLDAPVLTEEATQNYFGDVEGFLKLFDSLEQLVHVRRR